LQSKMSTRKGLVETEASKRLAVRAVARIGEERGDESLMQVTSLLTGTLGADPFMRVKKLIRNMMAEISREQAKDSEEQGECAMALEEAKANFEHAKNNLNELKARMEKLGQSIVEDILEWNDQAEDRADEYNNHKILEEEDIPKAVNVYNDATAKHTEILGKLQDAEKILQTHFGVTSNDNRLKEEVAGALDFDGNKITEDGRKINDAGNTRGSANAAVGMIKSFIETQRRELKTLREKHVQALKEMQGFSRTDKGDYTFADERAKLINQRIMQNSKDFFEARDEAQERMKIITSAGHAVQEIGECGVQTDTKLQRMKEIAALKEAYETLAEEPYQE